MYTTAFFSFLAAFITTVLVTPIVIKLAPKFGLVDKPNARRVHKKITPTAGGIAIFAGVAVGFFVGELYQVRMFSIITGGFLILLIGLLDDRFELSARFKLLGQIVVALILLHSDLSIQLLKFPFFGEVEIPTWLSPIITIIWIVAVINAINLIDGLDGLAAGVSSIGIITIGIMAALNGNAMIFTLSMILVGSNIGFLFYNFPPAKIFMGDTGALFIGYLIAVLSLLGVYKSVTLFSLVIPIVILGVPVFDTTAAIIRRILHKRPISSPDKSHLHHRLMDIGLSPRISILVIYCISIVFSISAILLEKATMWGAIMIIFIMLILIEIFAELIEIVHVDYKPIIRILTSIFGKNTKEKIKRKS